MVKTADVVVIGGGINGCTSAYSLRRHGAGRVVVVEKGHVASGPTGLSSGVVRQHYSNETLAAMARDSVRIWERFAEVIGGSAGFVQCGVVFFAGPRDEAAVRGTAAMHERIGIRERVYDRAELKDFEPRLYVDDIAVGVYEPDGGYADPALAATSYAQAAEREGVEVMRNTEVTGLRVEGGRVRGVFTSAGEIATNACVVAAGPWSGRIAAMAGIDLPIKASRHAVVMLRRPAAWTTPSPVWGDLVTGWYFKPDGPEQMMVGSIQDIEDEAEIDRFEPLPTPKERDAYARAIVHRFPIMEDGSIHRGWAALYDVTPDWQPVIDRIAQVDGLILAAGFSGHGFKIAPAVGTIVSELVVDGRCTTYDISSFRFARFDEHRSSHGAYTYGIVG